jgi:hypothetical protein
MKQVIISSIGLCLVTASQPKKSHNNNFDLIYGAGGLMLDKIEVLVRGGENLIAGLSPGIVPIYYSSLSETPVSGIYGYQLYSMNSFAFAPVDPTIDELYPNAVALVI